MGESSLYKKVPQTLLNFLKYGAPSSDFLFNYNLQIQKKTTKCGQNLPLWNIDEEYLSQSTLVYPLILHHCVFNNVLSPFCYCIVLIFAAHNRETSLPTCQRTSALEYSLRSPVRTPHRHTGRNQVLWVAHLERHALLGLRPIYHRNHWQHILGRLAWW